MERDSGFEREYQVRNTPFTQSTAMCFSGEGCCLGNIKPYRQLSYQLCNTDMVMYLHKQHNVMIRQGDKVIYIHQSNHHGCHVWYSV